MKIYQSRCQLCSLALTVMRKIKLMTFYLPIKESVRDLGKFKRSCKIPTTREQLSVMTEKQDISFSVLTLTREKPLESLRLVPVEAKY